MKMSLKERLASIKPAVYILIIFFAWSSWIDINGVWVELPLLVNSSPEGWNLPSYLAVIIQVANIGPIIYLIANRSRPDKFVEWPVIYIIIGIGAVACFLLAFLWDRTTYVGGSHHSTALLTLTAFLSIVDCTSSVAYLPYMAKFQTQYITAFYIGEGFGGLLPGLVGLIQGVGGEAKCVNSTVITHNETTGINTTEYTVYPVYDPPRFSVQGFFFFLFGMICVSGICFTLIHFLPYVKRAHLVSSCSYELNHDDIISDAPSKGTISIIPDKLSDPSKENGNYVSDTNGDLPQKPTRDDVNDVKSSVHLNSCEFVYVLILSAWSPSIMYGVMASVSSYSVLPYGNLAYSLALRLAAVVDPLMSFLSLLLATRSLVTVGVLSMIGTILAAFQLYLAALSPFPPYKGEDGGIALVVVTYVVMFGCLAYVKVTNTSILLDYKGHTGLLWAGGFTQIGSALGAIITFIVINVGMVFQAEYACSSY